MCMNIYFWIFLRDFRRRDYSFLLCLALLGKVLVFLYIYASINLGFLFTCGLILLTVYTMFWRDLCFRQIEANILGPRVFMSSVVCYLVL